jgi:fatty-acyl-CoA synthase
VAIDFPAERRGVGYAELDSRSDRLAAGLAALGVRRGDRIATLTGNRPEHVEVLFACAKAGLVLTPLNPRLAAAELAYQLDDAEPALLLAAAEQAGPAERAAGLATRAPRIEPLTRAGPAALPAAAAAATTRDAPYDRAADDDGLLLIYTSGTTGRPKGAVLTHSNCFWTNLSFDLGCGLSGEDVVLQVLPQFHVGGWNVQPLLAWWKGATVVLAAAFDAGEALRLIEERRITTMMGVPATYLFMAEHPAFATTDLTGLRQVVVGGAPMPESLLETWLGRGVRITQGYGLTEAAPNVLCLPPEHAADRAGWAGRPYPHVDVALRDTASGALLDGPGRGELLVRGPNVFAGYWRDRTAGDAAVTGGWLRTGDVAERDAEGFYRIRDRIKDMYISGGENVYPAEVESVLHAHPDVAEAAVIGVPDERWGEAGCAFVVPRPGARVDADALIAHCRGLLAAFKVPRHVRTVERLPRSAVDKVLKTELRALHGPGPGAA